MKYMKKKNILKIKIVYFCVKKDFKVKYKVEI